MMCRLQLKEVLGWLRKLDVVETIEDPRLLMSGVRASFYSGDTSSFHGYFSRLKDVIEPDRLRDYKARYSSPDFNRFVSEYNLFSKALGFDCIFSRDFNDASPADLYVDESIEDLHGILQLQNHGQICSLLPRLEDAIFRVETEQDYTTYFIYGATYFWALILSCDILRAEEYIDSPGSSFKNNVRTNTDILDWIDVCKVFLLRMKGDFESMDSLVDSLLASHCILNDYKKLAVLRYFKMEYLLLKGQINNAYYMRLALSEYSYPAFYKFNILVPIECVDQYLSALGVPLNDKSGSVTTIFPNENQTFDEQTSAIYQLKLSIYQDYSVNVESLIHSLHEQFSKSGQWLRVLELDSIRAVVLYRNGNKEEGLDLFEKVVLGLSLQSSLGVLFDPFLLWEVFLRGQFQFQGKAELAALYDCIRSGSIVQGPEEEVILNSNLSKRELQVLKLIVEGQSSQQIADRLFISITTVRTHIQKIYRKLNVKTRAEATALAIKESLIQ